jgi:hypothetical protein
MPESIASNLDPKSREAVRNSWEDPEQAKVDDDPRPGGGVAAGVPPSLLPEQTATDQADS